MPETVATESQQRAARSGGASHAAIYRMVERALAERNVRGEVAADFGCGGGALQSILKPLFRKYIGIDAVRYPGFPADADFISADLNHTPFPIADRSVDCALTVETIEHLENPRALVREMVRIAKPGASIVITTPNQLSFLSLGTLILKRRFSAFQDVHYPAHITALLECDLLRLANEVGLVEPAIEYSRSGRIVFTALPYPRFLSNSFPRLCSDNLLLIGRAP